MKRLGHASAAARRYLHAVEGRDAEIAAAISQLAKDRTAAKLPRSIQVGVSGNTSRSADQNPVASQGAATHWAA